MTPERVPVPSPRSAVAVRLRLLASTVSLLVLLALAAGGWLYSRLRASLPLLDGTVRVASLGATVTVQRDANGVPTIRADTRVDAARALGFLHGQDRFFQMDLMRRKAAGELAELVGAAAVPLDRSARLHGFRALAEKVAGALPPEQRALLEAYADGVNAGLQALGAKPFEYYVLRTAPQPWRPEDCALVLYAMALTLGEPTGHYEHSLDTLRNVAGLKALAFFAPLLTPEDAALDGSTAPLPPIPGPEAIDLRRPIAWNGTRCSLADEQAGSNSLAVSGAHTTDGAAVLANDMHLDLGVPNIWYRASLVFGLNRLTGLTLPGSPSVVAGSNGHIAWGFTAAEIDAGDLIPLETVPNTGLYRVPHPPVGDELKEIDRRREEIRVKGSAPVEAVYEDTLWGPIVGKDSDGHPLAYRWIEHDPAATNFALLGLEQVTTADEAVALVHRAGVPALNFLVADDHGHIAWTIAGRLPRRVGYDGRLPVSWKYGDRSWNGFVPADEVPTVVDPAAGVLWTANNRLVGGAGLGLLGDGGYFRPARAAQVRDGLTALVRSHPQGVKPADLLAIELDDRALFLERWHDLLLATLTPAAVAEKPSRGALRAAAEKWEGRADTASVSYPLVAAFHQAVVQAALGPLFARCQAVDPEFDGSRINFEAAVWALLQAKPAHLLDPKFARWDDLLLAAADEVARQEESTGRPLGSAPWGERNRLRMQHPFARIAPAWAVGWLNMPAEPLPGDSDMPRIQHPSFGASERFAVAPGHEDQGVCEMPGGESGHPLSPFYRAGHEAWVRGEPTPFLPGQTAHTLILRP